MSMSAGKWCVLLLLLCLHAGLGAGKNCSLAELNPNMVSDSEGSTNQSVQVHCEEQYLLVPEDLDTVTCDTTTGKWNEQPQCQPIPSVRFPSEPVSQDMKIQVLNIPVTLTSPVVREFDIDVSVSSGDSGGKPLAVVTTDFRLNTTSLHMTGGMKKANVTVILIDKGDIVIDKGDIEETKTFQLCLAVAKNESVNEERATVLMKRRCISVSINNTYKRCSEFKTSRLGHNLKVSALSQDKLTVGCKQDFLLVPEGLNYIICNKTTGKWTEQPHCQPIPVVKFSSESEIHNMNEGDINLAVTLTPPVVREFCVNVSVNITGESEGPTMAVNDKDFNLKTTMLHLAKGSNVSMVAVGLMDTKVSGRTKTFRLCLTLAVNESVMEKRAILSKRRCINVSITNTYDTSLSLINESHIFTNKSRSLGFIVGYRTCEILLHLTLTLTRAESEEEGLEKLSADMTIPQTCQPEGVCVVELSSFAFSREQIGEYSAVLTPGTDDCKITQDEITTMITLTLTPQEVEENGTFVEFKDQLKSVIVNTTNSSINWDGQVNVKFSPPPSFLFRLDLKILVFSEDSSYLDEMDVSLNVEPHNRVDKIDITQVLVNSIDVGCGIAGLFKLSLIARTSPSVAIATNNEMVFGVYYVIGVWFEKKQYRADDGVQIVINTTRCIEDLSNRISVSAKAGETVQEWNIMWNMDKSWNVVIPSDIDILTTLTLTLTLRLRDDKDDKDDDVIELTRNNNTATYTTGTEVSFERRSYTTREIKVNSTRALHKYQLSELVTIKLTSSTDEDADLDPYSQSLKLNITPNDDEGHTWLLTIPDYPHSVILTLELEAKNKDIVKIGIKKCEVTFVHEEEEAPHPVPVPPRSKFSFTAMVVVFIFFVVLAVVVYVAFSKRDQLMEWVRSAGGEEGGGGTGVLSKARKRLRSRGAYKKLPTSVQDAMSMRHTD